MDIRCANCDEPRAVLTCTRCKHVRYCSRSCQAQHWRVGGHRNICRAAPMLSISKADFDALMYATKLGDITAMKLILFRRDPNLIIYDEVI